MSEDQGTQSRHAILLEHIRAAGRARVTDLAELLATTPQTIRKDLSALAAQGRVMRFHGGAALLAGVEYTGFAQRTALAVPQKEDIARAAARLVPNRASVFLNAGTTTAVVARQLRHHAGLTIVTDSVNIANELRSASGVNVIVPGGPVRRSDGVILGEDAVDFLRRFRMDVAIIGAAAIAPDGALLDYDLREAAVARTMIGNARHVILCADSTKFGGLAPVQIGHLSEVRTLVTDTACPPGLRQLCMARDIELIEAPRAKGRAASA